MPLLEGRELLERQRVDPAELGQRALGGAQPLGLLLAVERRPARGSPPPRPPRPLNGDQLVGAVVGDQGLGVEAELLERALLELLDAHPLLGAGHLVAVHGVDQLVELAAEVAQPLAGLAQLLLATGAALLDAGALGGGRRDRLLEPGEHDGHARARPPRRRGPRAGAARGGRSPRPGRRARPARPAAASRPGRAGRGPAPRSCAAASRASISAARAARDSSASRSRSAVSGSSSGASSARRAATPARRAPRGPGRGPPAAAAMRLVEALGLGAGVAGLRAVLAELLGHRGQRRVGLVQLGQRDVDPAPGLLALALEGGDVEGEPLEGVRGRARAARSPRRRPPAPRSGSAGSRSRRRRSGRRAGRRRG